MAGIFWLNRYVPVDTDLLAGGQAVDHASAQGPLQDGTFYGVEVILTDGTSLMIPANWVSAELPYPPPSDRWLFQVQATPGEPLNEPLTFQTATATFSFPVMELGN